MAIQTSEVYRIESKQLYFGVQQQGETYYNGILHSRIEGALPRSGGAYEITTTSVGYESIDTDDPNAIPVQREEITRALTDYGRTEDTVRAKQELIIDTMPGMDPLCIKNAGAYFIFGDSDSGKSFFVKGLCYKYGGKRVSITEPDGSGLPGNAFGYSLVLKQLYHHARTPEAAPFYAIDSLLAASIFGEALAAGGVAKSVFLLGSLVNQVAKLAETIILVVLNPLSDMDNTTAYSVVEKASKANTQGVLFTQGVQDTQIPNRAIVQIDASFRPMRKLTRLPPIELPSDLPETDPPYNFDIRVNVPL